MLRGRRVLWLLFVLAIFFTSCFCPSAFASESGLAVTANVPLSTEWQTAIAQQTLLTIESMPGEINQPVKLIVKSRGINQLALSNQNLQITVLLKNKIIQQQKIISNNEGIAGFAFVPTVQGNYKIECINLTYNQPIYINQKILFEIAPSPLTSITSFIVNIVSRR